MSTTRWKAPPLSSPGCSEGRAALLSPTRVCPRSPTPARSWCGCAGSTASRYRRPRGRARSSRRSPCPACRRSGSRLKAFSTSNKSRKEHLETLRHEHRTIVLYEAPHKLAETLGDLYDVLGDRDIALGREPHEAARGDRPHNDRRSARKIPRRAASREFVLVIRGAPVEKAAPPARGCTRARGGIPRRGHEAQDAAKRAAAETGQSRNDLYHATLVREKETGTEE